MVETVQSNDVIQLISRIKLGDNEAFNVLQEQYGKALSSYVWKNACAALGAEDIKDIISDTWAEVFAGIRNSLKNQYNPEKASFYTYIINIARFKILNQIKYNYRNSPAEEKYPDEEGHSVLEYIAAAEEDEPENTYIASEQKKLRQKAYLEMLEIIFLCGGYPHQQFSFLLSKLMNGKDSRRATEGKLELIYSKYSGLPFSKVNDRLKQWITLNPELERQIRSRILSSMQPIELRLELKVRELMDYDKASSDFYAAIAQLSVKESCFQDYYLISRDSRKAKSAAEISNTISNWILKLEERVRKMISLDDKKEAFIKSESACSHCKLQKLPPCLK